jgi:hypothetical protein
MRTRRGGLIAAALLVIVGLIAIEISDHADRVRMRQMLDHADRDASAATEAATRAKRSAGEAEGAANAVRNLLPGSS